MTTYSIHIIFNSRSKAKLLTTQSNMQIASTHSVAVERAKRSIDGRRSEVATALTANDETNPKGARKFMLKTRTINQLYLLALAGFVTRLSKDQGKAIEDNDVISVTASVEAGRKYDKIILTTLSKHPSKLGEAKAATEVRFFVERESGRIFGAKSPLAPNENRFFGTVFNAKLWDWSGKAGVAVNDASVVEVGGYGGVKHYAEAGSVETETVKA